MIIKSSSMQSLSHLTNRYTVTKFMLDPSFLFSVLWFTSAFALFNAFQIAFIFGGCNGGRTAEHNPQQSLGLALELLYYMFFFSFPYSFFRILHSMQWLRSTGYLISYKYSVFVNSNRLLVTKPKV